MEECPICHGSEIEEVYGGHGTVLEVACSACQTTSTISLVHDEISIGPIDLDLVKDVSSKPWHIRHDDEIWCDDDTYVGACADTEVAEQIIALHNSVLAK